MCRRFEGGAYKMPAMAPLPKSRVSQDVPFSSDGLDYLGTIQVKFECETRKRWICLFTCTVTRALHIEMVHDLTSEEFLYALRRFNSTRGTPCAIVSDNASQFKLSSNAVQSVWSQVIHDEDVQNFASNSGIRWSFIIELLPWMGGFYERLVGLVKPTLRKTLKKKLLTDVQLQTILKEVEAIINSRPLVYVGDDINSRITLTPSHFLSLNPKVGIPEIDFDIRDPNYKRCESSSDKLLQLWKKGQRLLNSFWAIWREEYLIGLRERMQT
ncbi:unnamed protein product [Mytilus coruscus]|uniref:Integrase catalytic domain-containing protein n=1 Tax=Mytilus coruscus TaxID=42192 RepID=A0A6J8C6K4_MYTCO|nr:unnamed protein product [Mytilus coruscus]